MTRQAKHPLVHEVAAEAGFQLEVAKNYLRWVEAISMSIEVSLQHGKGPDVLTLETLVKYISCDALPALESAIDKFSALAETSDHPVTMAGVRR